MNQLDASTFAYDELVGKQLESSERTWTSKDALLYAVGVGAGQYDSETELEYTTENSEGVEQRVLPTFATLLQRPQVTALPFSVKRLVHGSQGITIHRPIPVEGTAVLTHVVTGVYDKGSGAVVVIECSATLKETDELLVSTRPGLFYRGEGGFGGNGGPETTWALPTREPDLRIADATLPGQALVYRLSGDRQPIHSDPTSAKRAGFDRPILQGLCTYGFVGRALINAVCEGDGTRFGSMNARFSKPVVPGEVVETLIWKTNVGALFQARVGDRIVLDQGEFTLAGQPPASTL